MIELKNCVTGKVLSLPTEFDEVVKSGYLEDCAREVVVAPNHVLVGLIYKEKLSYIISTSKNPNNVKPSIVIATLAADSPKGELQQYCGANVRDRLIITGTDLARAFHVNCKSNVLSINKVVDFVNSDKELLKTVSSLYTSSFSKILFDKDGNRTEQNLTERPFNYFVEFKIVPVSDIKGCYKPENAIKSNFIKDYVSSKIEL